MINNDELIITVPGRPVPTPRPRVLRSGHTYTPRRALEAQAVIAESWKACCGASAGFGDLPISVRIRFVIAPPESWTKKRKLAALNGDLPATSHAIGDLDNLAKTVLDALNGIAFNDDSQVTELHASKEYGEEERTEIGIMVVSTNRNKVQIKENKC